MGEYSHLSQEFLPVYDENSKLLILGSFPSVKSREQGFYYGHPKNRFWNLMAAVCNEEIPVTTEEKRTMLLKNHIAVWDVIEQCDIIGSSDSSIKNVVPADIAGLLEKTKIEHIFANGATAGRLYEQFCRKETGKGITVLPSTSPANAAWTLDKLTAYWEEELSKAWNQMEKEIVLTERISYLKAEKEPLSADVIVIKGNRYRYFFDVGNAEHTAAYLTGLPGEKQAVLSHFHEDHSGNLGRIPLETLYVGEWTERHLKKMKDLDTKTVGSRVTVSAPICIEDGVELEIFPVPSSHTKGSLALMVDKEYVFLGDALYPKTQAGRSAYNVQLLKEEIEWLKALPATRIFSSHEARPMKKKEVVLRYLEAVYKKRILGEPYIFV